MTNTKVIQFRTTDKGLEVLILPNGSAWCTQASYVRFSGRPRQTIVSRCSKLEMLLFDDAIDFVDADISAGTNLIKTMLSLPGKDKRKKHVVLIPAIIFGEWCFIDDKKLFREIVDAGATQFLYKIAGYEVGLKSVEAEKVVETKTLPPADQRILELVKELKKDGIDLEHPRTKQLLRDYIGDQLKSEVTKDKLIEPDHERWVGVVQRAIELGYDYEDATECRSQLGKKISHYFKKYPQLGLQRSIQNRECGGDDRGVWVYKLTEKFDWLIHEVIKCHFCGRIMLNE